MIILISAANSDVCQSMARILRLSSCFTDTKVIGLSPDGIWPAQQYFDEVLPIPMANDSSYGTALKNVVEVTKPDFFVPFSEAELSYFVKKPEVLSALKTNAVINPINVLESFLDKMKTANFLKENGVNVPRTMHIEAVTSDSLPVIIKPRSSAGSKNMSIIRNETQLNGFLEDNRDRHSYYVAQELIDEPDAEFTCAVWRGGDIVRHCTLRRRLQGGMTGFARVEQYAVIDNILETIARSLSGDFFINVQLRLRDNIPYVFEINPRFSSTLMMRHKIGFEDFLWTLNWKKNNQLPPAWKAPLGTTIFRVSEECIVKGETA